MASEKGSAFLLKVGDGASPPLYTTIAGLRTTQLSVNADTVVVTNKGSGGWRELLSGAGVRSVSLSGAGVFSGTAAEARDLDVALFAGGSAQLVSLGRALAGRDGKIVPVHIARGEGSYPLEWLVRERCISTNTTAAGGNANLMMIG